MSWQKITAGIVAVGLLGAGFYQSFGGHSALAARSVAEQPAPAEKIVELAPTESKAIPASEITTAAQPAPASAPIPIPAPPRAAQVASLPDVDPHKTRGSKTAPIAMETFSDFQCPACKQLYMGTNRQLMENYVTTGKVFLIHRDFPLPGHAYSRIAARYGRAASQLGKLEQVEQVLFQNQEIWEKSGDVDGTVATVLSPADMAKVRAMEKTPPIDAAIEKDIALGKTYNVNQTPTTVIHYKGQTYPVVGIVSYDVLHAFLDQLLASK